MLNALHSIPGLMTKPIFALVAALALSCAFSARAQTLTWTGQGGDANMATGGELGQQHRRASGAGVGGFAGF